MTPLEVLMSEVRRTFQAIRAKADALHDDFGVTAAMRAVLEHLSDGVPRSVPAIAREKNVTRQHIQQIVNALLAAGLARAATNPRHESSPLIGLTPRGVRTFARIRKREGALLASLAGTLDPAELDRATATLRRLTTCLETRDATVPLGA
jgi:DNA-binding MarR family transcriptional regulator